MKKQQTEKSPCIAALGTGSDVGKSIVLTAMCRFFVRQGLRTAPYKAQNMSNNSGVTPEGLEMGRAQIVQAEACGLPPHTDMNPILLKPTSDVGSQVVLEGRVLENSTAVEYHEKKEQLWKSACASLDRLRSQYDLVAMEGAGSCAEVNLMSGDIVNFRMAEYADAPVILIADIHRGGVFAQLVGTLACLPQHFQDRIAGFIINRFRGDIRLFEDGVKWIEEKCKKPVFGVLPWYNHISIEAEDSVVIEKPPAVLSGKLKNPAVAVIRIPHISNFTDFEPLERVEGLDTFFIEKPQPLSEFSAVILPGSKNTCYDLEWLHETGWTRIIREYAEGGGHVLGICGGYQLMGQNVHDPDGIEGTPGKSEGLKLLPVETWLKAPKTTTLSVFEWEGIQGRGYEIHMGQTVLSGGKPLFDLLEQNGKAPAQPSDGCLIEDGRIMATYMHGLFDTPEITRKWLESIGLGHLKIPETGGLDARMAQYDLLADHFEEYINTKELLNLIT